MNNKNNDKSIRKIETNGVEQIPDHERTAGPKDLFRLIFGGANTFATAVLGSFPVLFGLSFQAGVWAIVLGVLVGALILAPMGLFGPINGTNNAVSSGAHFGVHGRIVGSFLSLLTAIAFFSLSVWSSGDALVGGAKRLIGLPETDLTLGLAYGVFAILVLTVCIYGFRFMLWVNRIAVWAASLLFLLGIFAFAPAFDSHFAGTVALGQSGFWAAFIGAALVAMSNPISFGAFLGDWSRYIPRETPKMRIMLAVVLAQIATLIPFLFGMSTGTTSLYGTGLDMSSVFPRLLSRVKATLLIGVMSIAFIFIGRFAANLVQSVSTFAVLIITCTTPWMVMMIIGLIVRRGFYCPDDLQVFTRGETGGRYWFSHGWNWRGLGAWIPSALVGLCFVNLPGQFVGPLGNLADGIDISLPVTLGLASVVYLTLLRVFPEPAAVYGPAGASALATRRSLTTAHSPT